MQRLWAYLIDMMIVSVIYSVITFSFSTDKYDNYNKELSALSDSYVNEEISYDDYLKGANDLSYDIQKESLVINGIYLLVLVVYFVGFVYLNKGQSIGKKLCGLRINSISGKLSLWRVLVRNGLINDMFVNLFSLILLLAVPKKIYLVSSEVIVLIFNFITIVSVFMILYGKNKRGIHDIISGCEVIKEGR